MSSCSRINKATPKPGRAERQHAFLETKGYVVDKILAEGQFHVIKKAKSLKTGREVAIKFVDKLEGTPFPYLQRLLQLEWKALEECQHKNVVKFIEIINTQNTVYLVMGLADSGTLKTFVLDSEAKRVPEYQVRVWFAQLLAAIEHCHLSGWAHRSINVNDIFVDRKHTLKLGGFRYATPIVKVDHNIRPSQSFAVLRAYASPEILQKMPYDPIKFDIWCAGIVLYVMVTGCYPYTSEGKTDEEILEQMNQPLQFPKTDPPVSHLFKALVKMILTKVNRRLSLREIKKSAFMEPYYSRHKK